MTSTITEPVIKAKVADNSSKKAKKKKESAIKKGEAYKNVDLDSLNAFCEDFMEAPPQAKEPAATNMQSQNQSVQIVS